MLSCELFLKTATPVISIILWLVLAFLKLVYLEFQEEQTRNNPKDQSVVKVKVFSQIVTHLAIPFAIAVALSVYVNRVQNQINDDKRYFPMEGNEHELGSNSSALK